MVGYKVTEKGYELLAVFIEDREFIWVPGVDYDKLREMAKTLMRLIYNKDDEYFVFDKDDERFDPIIVASLEYGEYIERSEIPRVESYLRWQERKKRHPGRYPFLEDFGL